MLQTVKNAVLLSLWWLPRIFGILLTLFLGVFSFDIFGMGMSQWESGWLFVAHNIPTITVAVILILSWKRSWLGGISFTLFGIVLFFLHQDKSNSLFTVLTILGIGILFILNWLLRDQIKKAKRA